MRRVSFRGLAFFSAVLLTIASTVAAVDVGTRAPEIGAPRWVPANSSESAGNVQIGSFRNQVVLVDFWASWCEPCRESLPALNTIYEARRSRGFTVLGVTVDREARNIATFVARHPVSFPIVHDAQGQVAARYRPPRMPSSYLIDGSGVIRRVHAGWRSGDAATVAREIDQMLPAQAAKMGESALDSLRALPISSLRR